MPISSTRINVSKVSARYAMRRAATPKDAYDDSAAQVELLRVMKDSAPSIQRANKILDVNSGNGETVLDMAHIQGIRLGEQK